MAVIASGGDFEIRSQTTHPSGTTIKMTFPMVDPPSWFLPRLDVEIKKKIVIVDDDRAVHNLWVGRFREIFGEETPNHLIHFSSPSECLNWWSSLDRRDHYFFLVDYEFIGTTENGLFLGSRLNLGDRFILVTSRFDDRNVLRAAAEDHVKVLPKALIPIVPIVCRVRDIKPLSNSKTVGEFDGPSNCNESSLAEESQRKVKYDLCLIDDDVQIIHPVWEVMAKERGFNIRTFATPKEFFKAAENIDRMTPIFIDVSLGESINGSQVAHEVHSLGFVDVNLATGYHAESIDVPFFIRRVVGKEFPL